MRQTESRRPSIGFRLLRLKGTTDDTDDTHFGKNRPCHPWLIKVMTEIDIVRASWRDVRALSELDRRCFLRADAFGWLTYLGVCLWPDTVALKSVTAGQIVGFVAGDPRRREGCVIIITLGVDPAWRGRGIGARLMRECERECAARFDLPRLRLQVRQSNAPAIRLYRKLDYTIIDRLPRYYGDGEDGYLMEKNRRGQGEQRRGGDQAADWLPPDE